MKINEQGRSMVEMLGVLAIVGVLSIAGIAGYSKAMNKYKTNKVSDQVSMIVANIRTLYSQQNTYKGLNNKSAISMGVIPEEMRVVNTNGSYDDEKLMNAFNGNVWIGYGTSSANSDTRAFLIEYDGLPRNSCVTLATGDWGSGTSSGLIGLQIKGTAHTTTASIDDIMSKFFPSAMAADNADASNITDITSLVVGCAGSTSTACPGGSTQTVPMNVAQAAAACNCSSGDTCSIVWKYY